MRQLPALFFILAGLCAQPLLAEVSTDSGTIVLAENSTGPDDSTGTEDSKGSEDSRGTDNSGGDGDKPPAEEEEPDCE